MENMSKLSTENKEQRPGASRNEDLIFAGGIKDEQLEMADKILASRLPPVQMPVSKPDAFGSVDAIRVNFAPEDMFEIPPAGEHKVLADKEHQAPYADAVVLEKRKQMDQKVLDTLLVQQLQANIAGETDEAARIGKAIELQRSRMSSK